MGHFITADHPVDQRTTFVPTQSVQDSIRDRTRETCIQRYFDPLRFEGGEDGFCVGKGCQRLVVPIEFDHLIDKTGMDAFDQEVIILYVGREFFEEEDDGIHFPETHHFFYVADGYCEPEIPEGGKEGFGDIAIIADGGTRDIENDQLHGAHIRNVLLVNSGLSRLSGGDGGSYCDSVAGRASVDVRSSLPRPISACG